MNRNSHKIKIPDALLNKIRQGARTDEEQFIQALGELATLVRTGQSKIGFAAGWIEGYYNGVAFPEEVPMDMLTRNWKRFLSGESPVPYPTITEDI